METKIYDWYVRPCTENRANVEKYTCSNCGGVKKPILKIFFVDNEGYNQYINLCKECMYKMHNIFVRCL